MRKLLEIKVIVLRNVPQIFETTWGQPGIGRTCAKLYLWLQGRAHPHFNKEGVA
jgi:hypothetical protein